jgi:hypothetical protein
MKIKIVKCSNPNLWYSDMTFPAEFDVKVYNNITYQINAPTKDGCVFIWKEDCEEINIEGETKKFDDGKPSFSNVPQKAFWELMKVFKAGEVKYGKFNHSAGCEHTRLADGAVRHISQYLMGENEDEETETSHLANAAANCLMLLDQILNNKGVDNRNKIYINEETK